MNASSTMFFMKTISIFVGYEVQEEASHDFTSSTKDFTLNISEDNNITGKILYVAKENITSKRFRKITRSRFSI